MDLDRKYRNAKNDIKHIPKRRTFKDERIPLFALCRMFSTSVVKRFGEAEVNPILKNIGIHGDSKETPKKVTVFCNVLIIEKSRLDGPVVDPKRFQ